MELFLIPIVFGLMIVLSSLFTVKQQTAALVERLGKFQSVVVFRHIETYFHQLFSDVSSDESHHHS